MNRLSIVMCAAGLALCANVSFARTASNASPSAAVQPSDEAGNRQFQHAEALYLSGRLKDAASAFDALAKKYPNDPRVWLKYGNTLTKLGRYDEAASAFQSALNIDPTRGAPALNQALVRLAQAQASLTEALARLAPDSPEHAQAESLLRQITASLGASH